MCLALVFLGNGVLSMTDELGDGTTDTKCGWQTCPPPVTDSTTRTTTPTPTPTPSTIPTRPPYCVPTPPPPPQATMPAVVYSSNCDYCDHDLYTLTCIANPLDCGARCAAEPRCSHFTYIANLRGGTCRLKRSIGSGGGWASVIPAPSPYICGFVRKRAFSTIQLNLCVGLDNALGTVVSG